MKQPSRGRDPESTCRGCRRRRTRCRLGPTAGSRRAGRAKSGCRVHQGHGLHGQEVERWCGREGNQARQWETSREDYPADKTVIMPAAGGRSGHKPFPDLGLQQSAPKARSPLSSVHATLAGSVELEVLSLLCRLRHGQSAWEICSRFRLQRVLELGEGKSWRAQTVWARAAALSRVAARHLMPC